MNVPAVYQQAFDHDLDPDAIEVGTQCLVCRHVEAPAQDADRCAGCGAIGIDVRAFALVDERVTLTEAGLRWLLHDIEEEDDG